MSVQAGIWNFDGKPAEVEPLHRLSDALAQHGADGSKVYTSGSVGMIYRPFYTTAESRNEQQPLISARGNILTWDGRLDNRRDLANQLQLPADQTDAAIVLAAYDRWGSACFPKLLGDWALAIWDAARRSIVMARDVFAVRHLYYQITKNHLIWCTSLAPLMQQPGASWKLDDDYIAGYLISFPEAHRTPYVGLSAVPPAGSVEVRDGKARVNCYWNLDPRESIRYKTDAEYEHHFRDLFRQSVARRLRADAPILSELSGGMDSSSIVCMADDILDCDQARCPRLDTITIYDDLEPTGDERVYARHVETKRGREGRHIHAAEFSDLSPVEPGIFVPVPGYFQKNVNLSRIYSAVMRQQGNRVVLSGTGGDEFLGGLPDPRPQLADLLVTGHWRQLAEQLIAWSRAKKRPLTQLLGQTMIQIVPDSLRTSVRLPRGASAMLASGFAMRCRLVAWRMKISRGPRFWLPTQIVSRHTWEHLSRQLAHTLPSLTGCFEYRYPYLDRDLVDYLTAIPDDQLLRPGDRRSLMRRALIGLVPVETLERRTKGAISRRPAMEITRCLQQISPTGFSGTRYLDAARLRTAVVDTANGKSPSLTAVLKAVDLLAFCHRVSIPPPDLKVASLGMAHADLDGKV
jgi:asparagine synthase (glutamine-hydrolysing)